MKQLHLIFHQIQLLFRHHKSFSMLLSLAQLLGVIILLFSAATIQSLSAQQKEIDQYALYFEVSMIRYTDETEQVLIGYDTTDGKNTPIYSEQSVIDYSYALSWDTLLEKTNAVISESPIESQPSVEIKGHYNRYNVMTFLDRAATPSTGTVWLSAITFPDYSVGDDFQLGEYTLKVADISANLASDICVSPESIPAGYLGTRLRLDYETAPTTSQAEEMERILAKYFDYNEIHIPETAEPLTVQFNSMAILCTALMLVAVLLNICYAQLYRFRLAKHSFSVYRMVGSDTKTISSLCLMEVFITSAVLYTVGVLLFHFFLRQSVSLWYEAANTLYTPSYYLMFGICYLLFQVILLLLPLNQFIRREVAAAEKEADA